LWYKRNNKLFILIPGVPAHPLLEHRREEAIYLCRRYLRRRIYLALSNVPALESTIVAFKASSCRGVFKGLTRNVPEDLAHRIFGIKMTTKIFPNTHSTTSTELHVTLEERVEPLPLDHNQKLQLPLGFLL
jgi:hypothetical protein